LRDDLAIKRIPVMPWQAKQTQCVLGSVRQDAKVKILYGLPHD